MFEAVSVFWLAIAYLPEEKLGAANRRLAAPVCRLGSLPLLLVAGARHGTMRTVAATGGFAFFLILYQTPNDEGNDYRKNKTNQNSCKIV